MVALEWWDAAALLKTTTPHHVAPGSLLVGGWGGNRHCGEVGQWVGGISGGME